MYSSAVYIEQLLSKYFNKNSQNRYAPTLSGRTEKWQINTRKIHVELM